MQIRVGVIQSESSHTVQLFFFTVWSNIMTLVLVFYWVWVVAFVCSYRVKKFVLGSLLDLLSSLIFFCVFAGDITQKGYEKKRTKLLAPYIIHTPGACSLSLHFVPTKNVLWIHQNHIILDYQDNSVLCLLGFCLMSILRNVISNLACKVWTLFVSWANITNLQNTWLIMN